jgi:hypothetical protein
MPQLIGQVLAKHRLNRDFVRRVVTKPCLLIDGTVQRPGEFQREVGCSDRAHDPALALDQDEPDHFRGRWVGAFLRTAPPAAGVHQAKSDTISLLTEPDEQEKHGRLDKQGRLDPARLDRGDFGAPKSW